MRNDSFAVIVPAFDEAPNMPDLIAELRDTFARHQLDGEVVIVDDGSTDGTLEAAAKAAGNWDRLTLVRHSRNLGKTEAIISGKESTDARWLVVFDADLQHSTEEIPRFVDRLKRGWDIVTGRKVGYYEKSLVSRIYNWISRVLFRVPVTDMNSIKAFDREVLDRVRLRHDWHRFFVVLAHAKGARITEIDVALFPRRHGTSKYTGAGRVVGAILDLTAVWFYLRFSRKPMMFFGIAGTISLLLSIVIGTTTVVMRFAEVWSPIGYRPPLMLISLLALLGVILLGFGFIAELIVSARSPDEKDHHHQVVRSSGEGSVSE